jgi:hypothetical protein
MLRWSAENLRHDFNPESIVDTTQTTGIPGGEALIALVDATMLGTSSDRSKARAWIHDEIGMDGVVMAASTYGNFEMMNRIAEGTGIRANEQTRASSADWQQKLGLDRFGKGY